MYSTKRCYVADTIPILALHEGEAVSVLTCFELQGKAVVNSMGKRSQYIEFVCSCGGKRPLHNICHAILKHDRLRLHLACCYLQKLPTAMRRISQHAVRPTAASSAVATETHESIIKMTPAAHACRLNHKCVQRLVTHVLSPLGINSLQSSSTKRPSSALMNPPLACCARPMHACRQSPIRTVDRQLHPVIPTQGCGAE